MPLGLTLRLRAIAIVSTGLLSGATVGVACNVDTEPGGLSPVTHCSIDGGDALCVANFGSRPYCSLCADESENQGCVSSPPVGACAPGGGFPIPSDGSGGDGVDDGMGTSTTEAVGADTSTGTSGSDGLDDTSTGALACTRDGLDPDCEALDAATPYCNEGVCVGCMDAGGDEFCAAGVAPETPACDADSGACVACDALARPVCGDVTPVCGASGACEACTEHAQCPDTACHISPDDPLAGSCFLPDEVRWVNNSAICPGMGTEAQPSCSLQATLAGIPAGTNRVVKVVASVVPITQRPETNGAYTVAILGVNGVPELNGNAALGGASFVNGGALTYLHNLRLEGNTQSHGIRCTAGQVWIDDTAIAQNAGWGIFDEAPCNLTMRRSTLHHNDDGGIRLFGGTLDLENSTVAVNGNGSSGPGIDVQFATIDLLYSTIVGNDGATSDSITCNTAEGTLRNSIVQGVSPFSISLDCFGFTFTRNALDNSNFAQDTNVQVPLYDPIQFVDPAAGDFRLEAPPLSPFGDIARWEEGDPPLDADGTPRPTGGVLAYPGIDEPD